MGSVEDDSAVTWEEVLEVLMARMENACQCVAVHLVGWTGRRLRCHVKVGSGICAMSALSAIFLCKEVPTTLRWFFQVLAPS